MIHSTITIIRNEHAALAAILRSFGLLLAEHRGKGTLPDFGVLRAMLLYIDEFPERLHHPKESDLLFPKLRARSSEAAAVLDRLDHEHAQGETVLGEARREAFEKALERYVDFYLKHMALEEREILPLAQRDLTASDWHELDEAFADNRDPLTGHEPEEMYRALFSKIVNALPAPIGLGPATP
jgi:hemerythrin-like domain-containing protein